MPYLRAGGADPDAEPSDVYEATGGAGRVLLSGCAHALWMLGDESVDDRTFDARERVVIEAYPDSGRALVVSGSEVGLATGSCLESALPARSVADSADTHRVEGWTLGVTHPEDQCYTAAVSLPEGWWTWHDERLPRAPHRLHAASPTTSRTRSKATDFRPRLGTRSSCERARRAVPSSGWRTAATSPGFASRESPAR